MPANKISLKNAKEDKLFYLEPGDKSLNGKVFKAKLTYVNH